MIQMDQSGIKQYTGINAISKKEFSIDVGYERFWDSEIFFHPEVSFVSFFKIDCFELCCRKYWLSYQRELILCGTFL